MSISRKNLLVTWLARARQDLEHVAREVDQMPDDVDGADVSQDLTEVRARVEALECRVSAIEGTKFDNQHG